ncbi:regulator of chromosome condensation 1/beta-lactamase-inhibitor protein II [Dendryphion nanum]|uniref:Regulator of chromosome condensation 1/beta-lactamase-inhibitor protein II n=1 Tax=Dendryphion nanum TaxID=256645 RepID=A0A9P9DKJ6_9PLEO|nr:regulator of chromosome condensation 1/beta-lactamase-inhibitor protein II [Dendryphion nanum]
MDLYVFGFNGHGQLDPSKANILLPTKTLSGATISIHWTSWSDALITTRPTNSPRNPPPEIVYTGTGLNTNQLTQLTQLTHFFSRPPTKFFTSDLSDSLRGTLSPPTRKVTFFTSDQTPTPKAPISDIIPFKPNSNIEHISTTGGGTTYITLLPLSNFAFGRTYITHFHSLWDFRTWLRDAVPGPVSTHQIPSCTQLVSNATTTTALTGDGQVYTWTADPRYPRCLGRVADASEPPGNPHVVPYLSETKVRKVTAGGYMTAAISEDGELFLWGQACPGTDGELEVLRMNMGDEDEDDYVKCVPIYIDGREARVKDVAIGSGHIIVAAEVELDGVCSRAVFAAGQGESGQLGMGIKLNFTEAFERIEGLDGREVMDLAAAGWSSWVLLKRE